MGNERNMERGHETRAALQQAAATLQRQLAILAAEIEHWWHDPTADNSSTDLAHGARLCDALERRLLALAAVRRRLTQRDADAAD